MSLSINLSVYLSIHLFVYLSSSLCVPGLAKVLHLPRNLYWALWKCCACHETHTWPCARVPRLPSNLCLTSRNAWPCESVAPATKPAPDLPETPKSNNSPNKTLEVLVISPRGLFFVFHVFLKAFCVFCFLTVWVTCPFPEYMGMLCTDACCSEFFQVFHNRRPHGRPFCAISG